MNLGYNSVMRVINRLFRVLVAKANSIPKFIMIVIGILLLYSLLASVLRYRKINIQLSEARINLSNLNLHNDELSKEVSSVKTLGYVEKEARDKLGLAYEGEKVLVLPDESTLRKLSPRVQKEEGSSLPDPNWKKWWNLFF